MKRFLTHNLPLKIISVVVALVIYLFVMQEKEGEREITVPVRVVENLDGYVLRTQIPDLRVMVSGRTRHLARLQSDTLDEVVVHLNETDPIVTFTAADIRMPPGLEVESIFPDSIQLSYAHLVSREVPISVNYRGRPHPDYSIANVQVTPSVIRVTGPEEQVEDLSVIRTSVIDLYETDTDDVRRRVELVVQGAYMDYDRSQPIEVNIDIEPNQETIRLEQNVVLRGPTERFALVEGEDFVTVWLVGPPTLLGDRDHLHLDAVVDTTELVGQEQGRYYLAPRLINLPDGVRVERFEPATIAIVIGPREATIELTPVLVPVPGLLPLPLPPLLIEM